MHAYVDRVFLFHGGNMSLINETEKYLLGIINDLGYNLDRVKLEPSGRKELGQFQINEAFSLAKMNHENPREVANKIVEKLDSRFVNVNIAGPGFINISFSDEILIDYFNKGLDDFNKLIMKHEPKNILIDYGGANAAKALHVGHMRSANIGEALKRLAKVLGHNVIGDVHLGDLGRQAGMLISELMLSNPDLPFFDPNFKGEYPQINLTSKDLGVMYPKASLAAKNDEERMNLVRKITAEIDKGNPSYTALWKQMVDISSEVIKKTYDKLNCHFELWEGELDAFKEIPELLQIMKPYLYESDGALVCDVKNEDDNKPLPPLMVIKNDGATIYATRDLGTILSRVKRFPLDEIWYVVDERQSLYFEQVFRASYKTKLVDPSLKLIHYGFGTINGQDGKPYKTRDGGVMELDALIALLKEEILKKIKEEITGEERELIADTLSIATLKFADLLPYRKTDYIFDPVKFSSLDGKTGPYVLYTLVRIKSLFKKSEVQDYQIQKIPNDEVKDILIKLLELPNILNKAYSEATLNYITEYLYEIASLFNKFYNNHNIMHEEDLASKLSYLSLSKLVYNVCHQLLDILAIDEVEKM